MLSKLGRGLWTEIKQGNFTAILIVVAGMYAAWVLVVEPVYLKLTRSNDHTSQQVVRMQSEITSLRMQLQKQQAEQNKIDTKIKVEQSDFGNSMEVEY